MTILTVGNGYYSYEAIPLGNEASIGHVIVKQQQWSTFHRRVFFAPTCKEENLHVGIQRISLHMEDFVPCRGR